MPDRALRRLSGDVYMVPTDHPELGPGCMGLPAGTTAVGAEVHDDYCDTGAAQAFQITAESEGFRIRAAHSGLCLGVPEAAVEEWAPLLQLPCDPAGSGQLFRFDPAGRVEGGPPG
ncbi:RICIN domain-containing protein [Actinokineospora soli]|uniref:RICIN domain-containing protein n=1 Tax=Actinokineospora soli TaxID=1048753 RepID=A0ABW2TTP7_9PSEU